MKFVWPGEKPAPHFPPPLFSVWQWPHCAIIRNRQRKNPKILFCFDAFSGVPSYDDWCISQTSWFLCLDKLRPSSSPLDSLSAARRNESKGGNEFHKNGFDVISRKKQKKMSKATQNKSLMLENYLGHCFHFHTPQPEAVIRQQGVLDLLVWLLNTVTGTDTKRDPVISTTLEKHHLCDSLVPLWAFPNGAGGTRHCQGCAVTVTVNARPLTPKLRPGIVIQAGRVLCKTEHPQDYVSIMTKCNYVSVP